MNQFGAPKGGVWNPLRDGGFGRKIVADYYKPLGVNGKLLIEAPFTDIEHPSMDKLLKALKRMDEIIYPFPNFGDCTVEVCEWISYLIPQCTIHVITYSCWD